MIKIIVAFDGLKFSESALQYALQISKDQPVHLVGVFLEDFTYFSVKMVDLIGQKGVTPKELKTIEKADSDKRKDAVEKFQLRCKNAGVSFSVHRDHRIALLELLHESMFADFIIIDAKETLTHYEEPLPTRFIKNLLKESNCPVILVPSKFKEFKKVIFLYDGSPSSMYAIKQFGYLFPLHRKIPLQVICVKQYGDSNHLPDNKLFKEWAKQHYLGCEYLVLAGDIFTEIDAMTAGTKEGILFIAGSYSRGNLSMLFRPSLSEFILRKLKTGLFVAHV